jgi:prepilin-type N-terminal cleavage/methylation domain-containing protein
MGHDPAGEQLMARLAKLRSDAGFTALELVISMVILGIIITPLVSSYILGIGTAATSNVSTTGSIDAINLSGFFASDVASAQSASTSTGCGNSGTILRLDMGTSAVPRFVTYSVALDPTLQAQTHLSPVYTMSRITCDAAGTVSSTNVVLNALKSPPTPACPTAASPCTGAATQPSSISLTITEWGRASTDPVYQFTVTGSRRITVAP